MQIFLQIIENFLKVYSLIIFGYIFASWLPGLRSTPIMQILSRLVEPYFSLFRKFPFARLGYFSLSPLYGFLFLNLLQKMITILQQGNRVTLGGMLSVLVVELWGLMIFLLGFFAIIAFIRLIFTLFFSNTFGMLTHVLDVLLALVSSFVTTLFFHNRMVNYRLVLVIIILLNVVLMFYGSQVIESLAKVLKQLPI